MGARHNPTKPVELKPLRFQPHSTRPQMSEQVRAIVDALNKPPFSRGLTLIAFVRSQDGYNFKKIFGFIFLYVSNQSMTDIPPHLLEHI